MTTNDAGTPPATPQPQPVPQPPAPQQESVPQWAPPQPSTPPPAAAPDAAAQPAPARDGSPYAVPQGGPYAAGQNGGPYAAGQNGGPYAAPQPGGAVPPVGPPSPYGAQPPPPGSGPYPGGPPARGGKGIAISAIVVAGVALLLSWVPIINTFAAVLAVVGLGLGIAGLVLAVTKGRPGKGLSIGAVVVAVVSIVIVIATQIVYGMAVERFADQLDNMATELESTELERTETREPAVDEEPAGPAAGELTVVESAFGQYPYDETMWWYVVVVDNPNAEHVFPSVDFRIEAIGADGTILDTDAVYSDVLPGRLALSGIFMSTGGNPIDHLEFRGPQATDAEHRPEPGAFTVAEVAASSNGWSTTVGGTVASTFTEDQDLVRVDVVARDAQGVIIGAEGDFVDRVPAGGQARFEAMFLETLPEGTTYEAYASR